MGDADCPVTTRSDAEFHPRPRVTTGGALHRTLGNSAGTGGIGKVHSGTLPTDRTLTLYTTWSSLPETLASLDSSAFNLAFFWKQRYSFPTGDMGHLDTG